ncbi:hypothetical protein VTK73DRAFT_555 [Phialemonium thermophilum]|uniref:Uncharacterized protein n=1 Tax=Phialemonium thermophilum TaxID=223376 RepID=A0ABR3VUR8_9PEZI
MDRTLDEILAERRQTNKRSGSRSNRGGNAGRRRERQDYPRDGVRKARLNPHEPLPIIGSHSQEDSFRVMSLDRNTDI